MTESGSDGRWNNCGRKRIVSVTCEVGSHFFCQSEVCKWEERIELVQGQWMFRIPRIALVGPLLALEYAVLGVLDSH